MALTFYVGSDLGYARQILDALKVNGVGELRREQNSWYGLLDELLTSRLTKVDLVSALEEMLDYGRQRFRPDDLIPRQDFFLGRTLEQSLAINVAGLSIVLVVGCGHPTVRRIIERAETLFEEPVYGVLGGLHFPVTGPRVTRLGLPMQRIIGTGRWPWNPIGQGEVAEAANFLKRHAVRLVALSPHDSCDWSLDYFRKSFGSACENLLVGREIVVRRLSRDREPRG